RYKLSPYKQEYEQRARDRARREQQLEEEEERKHKGLKPKPADNVLDEEGPHDLLNSNRTQLVQSTNQRALDRTMKVEHSTLDQVQKRLARLKKKQKEEKPQEYDFEARVEQMHQQEGEEKQKKVENNTAADNEGNEGEGLDPEMAKLMG
ncbi:2055_t:CDS:2, partial [Ambispora gerdemannii]